MSCAGLTRAYEAGVCLVIIEDAALEARLGTPDSDAIARGKPAKLRSWGCLDHFNYCGFGAKADSIPVSEWDYSTMKELTEALQARKISASELLDHTIARIEALDLRLNAVVVRDFERAALRHVRPRT